MCTGPNLSREQWLVGSLTGAVASQRVTEAFKGTLRPGGNRPVSANAKGCLTARPTSRAGSKDGVSDPTTQCGLVVAQRIKVTPGITGLLRPRVHIDGKVWHLDVGSSHPGAGVGPKGWAVRPLKRHASWVQNVVRQFGLYPSWAPEACGERSLVREDRDRPTARGAVASPEAPPLSGRGSARSAERI